MPDPLPDYSDYAYEHRPPVGSFRDWLQKHSVQRIGFQLFFLGVAPSAIWFGLTGGRAQSTDFSFFDYLVISWLFACMAISFTLYALKRIAPGIVTIYGPVAMLINGFFALISWGLALLSLYFGLCKLLGCGG